MFFMQFWLKNDRLKVLAQLLLNHFLIPDLTPFRPVAQTVAGDLGGKRVGSCKAGSIESARESLWPERLHQQVQHLQRTANPSKPATPNQTPKHNKHEKVHHT